MTDLRQRKVARIILLTKTLLLSSALMSGCAPSDRVREANLIGAAGIVHGTPIKDAEFGQSETAASTIALVIDSADGEEALCTGTLLDDSTALTAAHCVDHEPSSIRIAFGPVVKRSDSVHHRRASGFTQHPEWQSHKLDSRADLAVVYFAGGLPEGYRPVHLASTTLKIIRGMPTQVLGYGVTSGAAERGSGVLRAGNTSVLGRLSESEAVTDGRTSSVCFGDSGGPAFALENGEAVQWGITSAVSNHECNGVALHTVTSFYRDWIIDASKTLKKKAEAKQDQSQHGKKSERLHLN